VYFEFHAFVCINRRAAGHPKGSCADKDSERLRDYMKARARVLGIGQARVNAAMCLDRCESGPCVVVYPHGHWYRVENEADVDEVLAAYLEGGAPATRLLLPEREV